MKSLILLLVLVFMASAFTSCTSADEEVFDQIESAKSEHGNAGGGHHGGPDDD